MELEYESKQNKKEHWSAHIAEGCGCFLVLLGICMVFNFSRILDLIEKIFCSP